MNTQGTRTEGLLRWQWSLYMDGHRDRRNLAVHAATVPVFLMGTLAVVASPFAGVGAGLAGAVAMFASLAAQGRGHKWEQTKPVPFRGPADVVARFFTEQWVTFPRFVLSGRFAEAWRRSGAGSA